ncbi:MAG TPA: hypothetical protein VG820_02255, partial [Fimbriimonadaceae bacterium]|nr:hypothetical protein [Fimbriimonadaceae bacterium]
IIGARGGGDRYRNAFRFRVENFNEWGVKLLPERPDLQNNGTACASVAVALDEHCTGDALKCG